MNATECAAVMAAVKTLFTGWRPTRPEMELWLDTLSAWEREPVLDGLNAAFSRRGRRWTPDLSEILRDASASVSLSIESDRAAKAAYARDAEAADLEDRACAAYLASVPGDDLRAARRWFESIRPEPGSRRADPIGALLGTGANPRMRRAFMAIAVRFRLWEKGPDWWMSLPSSRDRVS